MINVDKQSPKVVERGEAAPLRRSTRTRSQLERIGSFNAQASLEEALAADVSPLPSQMPLCTVLPEHIESTFKSTMKVRIYDRDNHGHQTKVQMAAWVQRAFGWFTAVTINFDTLGSGQIPQYPNTCGRVAVEAAQRMYEAGENFMDVDLNDITRLPECMDLKLQEEGMTCDVLRQLMLDKINWTSTEFFAIADADSICMNIYNDVHYQDGIRHCQNHGAPGIYVFVTDLSEFSHYVVIAVQFRTGVCYLLSLCLRFCMFRFVTFFLVTYSLTYKYMCRTLSHHVEQHTQRSCTLSHSH